MQITHKYPAQGTKPTGSNLVDADNWNDNHNVQATIGTGTGAPPANTSQSATIYSAGDFYIQIAAEGSAIPVKTFYLKTVSTATPGVYNWILLSEGVTVVNGLLTTDITPPTANNIAAGINFGIGDVWCRATNPYTVNTNIKANLPSYICTAVNTDNTLNWNQLNQNSIVDTSGSITVPPAAGAIGTYVLGQMYFIYSASGTTAFVLTGSTQATESTENYRWSQISGGGGTAGVSSLTVNGITYTGNITLQGREAELTILAVSGPNLNTLQVSLDNNVTAPNKTMTMQNFIVPSSATPTIPEFSRSARRVGTWAYKNSTGTATQSIPAMTQGGGPTRLNQWLPLTYSNYPNDLAFIKAQNISGEAGLSIFRNISNFTNVTIIYQISVTLGGAYSNSYTGSSSYLLGCAGRGWTSGIIRQDDVGATPAQLINLTRQQASITTNSSGISGFDSTVLSLSGMYVVQPNQYITFFVSHLGNTITIPGAQSGSAFGQFDTGNVIRLTIYECI